MDVVLLIFISTNIAVDGSFYPIPLSVLSSEGPEVMRNLRNVIQIIFYEIWKHIFVMKIPLYLKPYWVVAQSSVRKI